MQACVRVGGAVQRCAAAVQLQLRCKWKRTATCCHGATRNTLVVEQNPWSVLLQGVHMLAAGVPAAQCVPQQLAG